MLEWLKEIQKCYFVVLKWGTESTKTKKDNDQFMIGIDFEIEGCYEEIMNILKRLWASANRDEEEGEEAKSLGNIYCIKLINADLDLEKWLKLLDFIQNFRIIDIIIAFKNNEPSKSDFNKLVQSWSKLNMKNLNILNAKFPMDYLWTREPEIEKMISIRNCTIQVYKDFEVNGLNFIFDALCIHEWLIEFVSETNLKRSNIEAIYTFLMHISTTINNKNPSLNATQTKIEDNKFGSWWWEERIKQLIENEKFDLKEFSQLQNPFRTNIYAGPPTFTTGGFKISNTILWMNDVYNLFAIPLEEAVLMIEDSIILLSKNDEFQQICTQLGVLSLIGNKFILVDEDEAFRGKASLEENAFLALKLFISHFDNINFQRNCFLNQRSFDNFITMWVLRLNSSKTKDYLSNFEDLEKCNRFLFKSDYHMVNELVEMKLSIKTNLFSIEELSEMINIQSSLRSFLNSETFFVFCCVVPLKIFLQILDLPNYKKVVFINCLVQFSSKEVFPTTILNLWFFNCGFVAGGEQKINEVAKTEKVDEIKEVAMLPILHKGAEDIKNWAEERGIKVTVEGKWEANILRQ
jgi:hypothetical protein